MTSLYLYGFTDRAALELPALAGIDGARTMGVARGALMAVVSPFASEQVFLSRQRLLQHEAVLEAVMEQRTVLPARFGTLATEAQISAALARHSAELGASLARVRGRVEIGLRVLWAAPDPPAPRPREAERADGRAYMQALLAEARQRQGRQDQAEALAAQLTASLAELTDAETHEILPNPRPLLKAAYLVRHHHVAEVRRRILALGAAHPDLALLATGPWPAYSFADVRQHVAPSSAQP